MMTYKGAKAEALRARRGSEGRAVGNNTKLFVDNQEFAVRVRYYDTDIVIIHADGTYTLDLSDWGSAMTTRKRVSTFAPVTVFVSQTRKDTAPTLWFRSLDGLEVYPLTGKVRVDSTGRPVSSEVLPATEDLIEAYVDGFCEHLLVQVLDDDDGVFPTGGQTLGIPSVETLLRARVYPPALLYEAYTRDSYALNYAVYEVREGNLTALRTKVHRFISGRLLTEAAMASRP